MPKALLKCSIVADHGKPLDNSTTIATPGADWKAFMTFEIDKALVRTLGCLFLSSRRHGGKGCHFRLNFHACLRSLVEENSLWGMEITPNIEVGGEKSSWLRKCQVQILCDDS